MRVHFSFGFLMIFGSFWNESGNWRTESRNMRGNVYFIVNLTNCRRFQWLKLSRTSINDILVDEGTDFVQNTVDDVCMSYKWEQSVSELSSSKKTFRIWAIFLFGKCVVLHSLLKNTLHSSDIKPISERSETEKSVKSIVFGNVH